MTLVKWDPIRELDTLHEDMDRLLSLVDGGLVAGSRSWTLATDVIETKDALQIKVALPGIDPHDIDVEIEGNILSIRAERRSQEKIERSDYHWIEQQYGAFSRSVTLPDSADVDHIQTRYRNGVLELDVPKRSDLMLSRSRRIPVNVDGHVDGRASRTLDATPVQTCEGTTRASWWERAKQFFQRKAQSS